MKVEVLGPGCPRCQQLLADVEAAAQAAQVEIELTKVAEPMEIAKRGVLMTPGLVIDGKIVSTGRLPERKEIEGWLTGAAQGH